MSEQKSTSGRFSTVGTRAGALVTAVAMAVGLSGCANFRNLGKDLKFMDETSIVTARVSNAGSFRDVYGIVVEWDREKDRVLSADFSEVGEIGVFGFSVKDMDNQFLMAFSDRNGNDRYDQGEPAWIHSDAAGQVVPIVFDRGARKGRAEGRLSSSTKLPEGLIKAAREFKGHRSVEEAASGYRIPIDLGTIANLDDPKFSSKSGEQGLWEPSSFPQQSGIGIYFLERYDPNKTPVLFVYGAAGSPQDWRTFFNKIDRRKYQPWFYYYPSGRRLGEMGTALNNGVKVLQAHYGFQRMHVVAHSMGGLVSRSFVTQNLNEGNRYIAKYATISTPWAGHKFAEMGVKRAPEVVPSWRDMVPDSPFQREVFRTKLRGRIPYMLLYSHKASRSPVLPPENDGTVAVESELAPPAVKDAVKVQGFNEDHVSILSNDEVIKLVQAHLGG